VVEAERSLLEWKPSNDSTLAAKDLARYITSKDSKIRASTASSPPPHIEDRSVLELLSDLRPATVTEVAIILKVVSQTLSS